MRRAHNVDANQEEIVESLRALGVWVHSTAGLGGGFPDLIVWFRGRYFLFEVKDGRKKPSARRLTDAEEAFHDFCPGPIHVVLCLEDVLGVLGLSVNQPQGAL